MPDIEVVPTGGSRSIAIFGIPLQRILAALIAVVGLGIYAGVLLFGPNSLTVLLGLEEQRTTYEHHIRLLKKENAALQKEYFELKQLEPDQ
ncbi:septum formation initiator [Hydrogenimonas urashimensis]|uniref:septum formation initiator n=1 Tax=Hydrogenimonas urashimensis TaxID=2740515 RepID=UPI00191609E2|nr:septum formation initiator [Hydrogenimonas urashimensis]